MDGAIITLRGKPFQLRCAATPNALDAFIVLVLCSVESLNFKIVKTDEMFICCCCCKECLIKVINLN